MGDFHTEQAPATAPTRRAAAPAGWFRCGVIALLALIAAGLWFGGPAGALRVALGQNAPMAGARGVYAFTGPIDQNRYGLFMIDIEQGTVWCYEIDNAGGTHKLRLAAARTWLYDRYLQDFNTDKPSFREVQALVNEQRAMRGGGQSAQPDSTGAAPGPDAATARPGSTP